MGVFDCWDEDSFLSGLQTLLDPVRVPYFEASLRSTPDAHVLDVGCGAGFVTSALSDAGYRMTGIDIAWGAVTAARRGGSGHFVLGNAHRMPFEDDSFDAVICSEVLEHVEDPVAVIAECSRVIRPGGRLLFSTPNRTILSRAVLIDLAQRWRLTRVLPESLHQWDRFIKPSELTDALAANDFSVEKIRGIAISMRSLPGAAMTLYRLRRGEIGFVEAGRRVQLRLGRMTAVAYIGEAVSFGRSPS